MMSKNKNHPTKEEIILIPYLSIIVLFIWAVGIILGLSGKENFLLLSIIISALPGLILFLKFKILQKKYPSITTEQIGELVKKYQIFGADKPEDTEISFNPMELILIIMIVIIGFKGYISNYIEPHVQSLGHGIDSVDRFFELTGGIGYYYLRYGLKVTVGLMPYFLSIFFYFTNRDRMITLYSCILILFWYFHFRDGFDLGFLGDILATIFNIDAYIAAL